MLHYILRFIITMKHATYGAILSAARGPGECCKLPQQRPGRSPSGNQIWCILAWKSGIWWNQFFIFRDFSQKYFPPTFPWPLKFPDYFQFSLTCSNPAIKAHVCVCLCVCLSLSVCVSVSVCLWYKPERLDGCCMSPLVICWRRLRKSWPSNGIVP